MPKSLPSSTYMSRSVPRRLELSLLRSPSPGCTSFHPIRGASRFRSPFCRSRPVLQQHLSSYLHTARPRLQHLNLQNKRSSISPYIVLLLLVGSTTFLVEYVTTPPPEKEKDLIVERPKQTSDKQPPPHDEFAKLFAEMSIPPGFLGNLASDQEQKLKDFWALVLQTFGVKDPLAPSGTAGARPTTPADSHIVAETHSAKKEKHGLFHRKHKDSVDSSGSSSPSFGGKGDPEDKYGQTKELQEILATSTPASLRDAFWSMVKKDHPDALLLRFLRARKWDQQRALAMMISTMHWRKDEMHVDDDIMMNGEGGALKDSQSSNPTTKKEGQDFLAQMRLGKSFIHGIDKEGRPISVVRVRLHKGGDQSERALERFTVYTIETCRLALQPPVETATIVFDMTSFTMANMDYTPVKFMIKVFEANYPESLGCVLVHKSPWIFQGIWKIIKGWLDPVVAAKVHFTNSPEDLQEFIPRSQIISELGGDEKWEYKYYEPALQEDVTLENASARKELTAVRQGYVEDYEKKTFDWVHGQDTRTDRDAIAKALNENYWNLDPYIRARSLYDRTGMIRPDGTLDFYPSPTVKKNALSGANGAAPPSQAASSDDVD